MAQHIVTKRILIIMDMIIEENENIKSASALARSLDYSPQSFDKVKNDDRNFPLELIYKFFKIYGINPSLVFNDDLWKKHSTTNKKHRFYQPETFGVTELAFFVDIENTMQVVMVSNENAKDYVHNHEKDEYIEKLSFMTFSNRDNDYRSLRGFEIKGDEMESNFFHGDWAFGVRLQKFLNFKINRIFIIVLKYDIIVRRIASFNEENNTITVSLDNHAYPNYEISLDTVFEIWEVENALQSRFPMPR